MDTLSKQQIVWEKLKGVADFFEDGLYKALGSSSTFTGDDATPLHEAAQALTEHSADLTEHFYESAKAALTCAADEFNKIFEFLRPHGGQKFEGAVKQGLDTRMAEARAAYQEKLAAVGNIFS